MLCQKRPDVVKYVCSVNNSRKRDNTPKPTPPREFWVAFTYILHATTIFAYPLTKT